MNTLKALKRCALGLDLYLWLTYRTSPSVLRYGSRGSTSTTSSMRTPQRQATTTPFNTSAARFCAS